MSVNKRHPNVGVYKSDAILSEIDTFTLVVTVKLRHGHRLITWTPGTATLVGILSSPEAVEKMQ